MRKRGVRGSKDFMQAFWDLASLESGLRCAAAAAIVKHLELGQKADLEYTLKRLVRGLASSRSAARQGFALCLAELLATFKEEVPLVKVMEIVDAETKVAKSMLGSEQREMLFARVFALLALERSGRLASEALCGSGRALSYGPEIDNGDEGEDTDAMEESGDERDEGAEDEEAKGVIAGSHSKSANGSLFAVVTAMVASYLYVAKKKQWIRELCYDGVSRLVRVVGPLHLAVSCVLPPVLAMADDSLTSAGFARDAPVSTAALGEFGSSFRFPSLPFQVLFIPFHPIHFLF